MFPYNKKITSDFYIPKKKKNVLLVSHLHQDEKIDAVTSKTEIIVDYNATKCGVQLYFQ